MPTVYIDDVGFSALNEVRKEMAKDQTRRKISNGDVILYLYSLFEKSKEKSKDVVHLVQAERPLETSDKHSQSAVAQWDITK